MRTLRVWTILIIVGLLCAVWSPWNAWNINLLQLVGIEAPPEIGGLVVTTLAGEIEVLLDNSLVGAATTDSPLFIPNIEPGEHLIRLQRRSQVDGAFFEYAKLIKFASGVDVVLTYELGPSQEFSQGHLIYATKDPNSEATSYLNITSQPAGAQVLIDDITIGTAPIVLYPIALDKQLTVEVAQPGYETQTFKLLPEDQAERDKLKGFDLNVEVNLFLQPIEVR